MSDASKKTAATKRRLTITSNGGKKYDKTKRNTNKDITIKNLEER
jgi:hypothetical protein